MDAPTEHPPTAYQDTRVTLHLGDCLDVMRALPANSVDAIVTDPPYGLGFMGKAWDDLPPGLPWARECLRVLKPGGHLLAFGGTRTWHRLAVAVEDAGFEVRDSIAWLYGSGFPKSHDVSKAIDKASGATRAVIGTRDVGPDIRGGNFQAAEGRMVADVTAPATPAAQQWAGWGTALKPAFEPVVVARKPLVGTVAGNVLAFGTGALNIDGCRVGTGERVNPPSGAPGANNYRLQGGDGRDVENARRYAEASKALPPTTVTGRWPANVVLDGTQADALDTQSGTSAPKPSRTGRKGGMGDNGTLRGAGSGSANPADYVATWPADPGGGASRFFPTFRYQAKAPTAERPKVDGVAHPTVKPLELMRWLVRLVTPPGGIVLEPFAGSGTTVEAALLEGFTVVAIEREPDYVPLILARVARATPTPEPEPAPEPVTDAELTLLDLLDAEGVA